MPTRFDKYPDGHHGYDRYADNDDGCYEHSNDYQYDNGDYHGLHYSNSDIYDEPGLRRLWTNIGYCTDIYRSQWRFISQYWESAKYCPRQRWPVDSRSQYSIQNKWATDLQSTRDRQRIWHTFPYRQRWPVDSWSQYSIQYRWPTGLRSIRDWQCIWHTFPNRQRWSVDPKSQYPIQHWWPTDLQSTRDWQRIWHAYPNRQSGPVERCCPLQFQCKPAHTTSCPTSVSNQ